MKKLILILFITLSFNSFAFELTNNFNDEMGCFCTARAEYMKPKKIYKNYFEARKNPSERWFGGCACGTLQISIDNQIYFLDNDEDRRAMLSNADKKLSSTGKIGLLTDEEKKVRVKYIRGKILKREYSELVDMRVGSIVNFTAEIEFNNEKKTIKGISYVFVD